MNTEEKKVLGVSIMMSVSGVAVMLTLLIAGVGWGYFTFGSFLSLVYGAGWYFAVTKLPDFIKRLFG